MISEETTALADCNYLLEDDYSYLEDEEQWEMRHSAAFQNQYERIAFSRLLSDLKSKYGNLELVQRDLLLEEVMKLYFTKLELKNFESKFHFRKIRTVFIASIIRSLILREKNIEQMNQRRQDFLSKYQFLRESEGKNQELTFLNRFDRAVEYLSKYLSTFRNKLLFITVAAFLEGSFLESTYYSTGFMEKVETKNRVTIIEQTNAKREAATKITTTTTTTTTANTTTSSSSMSFFANIPSFYTGASHSSEHFLFPCSTTISSDPKAIPPRTSRTMKEKMDKNRENAKKLMAEKFSSSTRPPSNYCDQIIMYPVTPAVRVVPVPCCSLHGTDLEWKEPIISDEFQQQFAPEEIFDSPRRKKRKTIYNSHIVAHLQQYSPFRGLSLDIFSNAPGKSKTATEAIDAVPPTIEDVDLPVLTIHSSDYLFDVEDEEEQDGEY